MFDLRVRLVAEVKRQRYMLSAMSVAASVWCETVLTDVIGRPTVVIAVVTAGVHLAIRFPEMEREG